jgi:hypothetical protein
MTAPVVTKRPALFLVPLLVGSVVAVGVGAYGRLHHPTGRALFTGPFNNLTEFKAWATVLALAFGLIQLLTALWMYGRLGVRAPSWAGALHRTTGIIAFLITVPVAFQCLWALGFGTYSARVLAHSLFGCVFYGAFVAKVLAVRSRRMPSWALPWLGGALFTTLVGAGLTSTIWYFTYYK